MANTYKQREEHKNKIFMILEANGGPMSSRDIAQHPTIQEDTRSVEGCLRGLLRDDRVIKKGGKWEVKHASNKQQAKMFFVMNLSTRSFMLDIEGVRLPLIVEP